MEIIAAAASIAGILTLVGQSINGIQRLREFFIHVRSASKLVDKFVNHLNSLLHVLEEVEHLLSSIPSRTLDFNVSPLHQQVRECSSDVFSWIDIAIFLRPPAGKRGRFWFKSFWVAVNKTCVKDISEEIDGHRQALTVGLAILGRYISKTT